MKKSRFSYRNTIILFLAVILTACNKPPKLAENPEIKSWILRNCTENQLINELNESFFTKLHKENITIEKIDPNKSNSHTTSKYDLESLDYVHYFENLLNQLPFCSSNTASYFLWKSDAEEYAFAMKRNGYYYNPERLKVADNIQDLKYCHVISDITNLIQAYFDYICDIADDKVTILQWDYEHETASEHHTEYLVTYEIENTCYALVRFVESENTDSYSASILYEGDTLPEIQDKRNDRHGFLDRMKSIISRKLSF